MTNGSTSVGHVVDQDGHSILHISDQDHGSYFIRLLPLLVDQRKVHV